MSCNYKFNGVEFESLNALKDYIASYNLNLSIDGGIANVLSSTKFYTLAKKDFGNSKTFKYAKEEFCKDLVRYLDLVNLVNTNEEEDPMLNRTEALSLMWNKYKNYEKNIRGLELDDLQKEAFRRLSNPRVFKNMANMIYSNISISIDKKGGLKFSNVESEDKVSDEAIAASIESLTQDPDNTNPNVDRVQDEWSDKGDKISPIQRASAAVQDFMFTTATRDKKGNVKNSVSHAKAFVYLLHGLDTINPYVGLETTSSAKTIAREKELIKENFSYLGVVKEGDYSTELSAVYNKVLKLVNLASSYKLNPNFELKWVGDNTKGHYQLIDKSNLKILDIPFSGSKSIVAFINTYMKRVSEEIRMSPQEVTNMYNSLEAADNLNSLYNVANSLRHRNPHFIRYNKNFFDVPGEDRKIISFQFDYNNFSAEHNRISREKTIINTLTYSPDDLLKRKLTIKSPKTDFIAARDILGLNIPIENINQAKILLVELSEAIQKLEDDPERYETDPRYKEEIMSVLISRTKDLVGLEVETPESKAVSNSSYQGGDSNQRWFYSLGSNITETLMRFMKKNPIISKTHKESRYKANWFLPVKNEEQLLNKKIFNIIDHDSIVAREKSIYDKPITYLNETLKDRNIRNVIVGFGRYLLKSDKKSSASNSSLRYIQQLNTPSNSPSLVSFEIEALQEEEYPKAVMTIFKQWAENITRVSNEKGPNKAYYANLLKNTPFSLPLSNPEINGLRTLSGMTSSEVREAFRKNKTLSNLLNRGLSKINTELEIAYKHFTTYNVAIPDSIVKMLDFLERSKLSTGKSIVSAKSLAEKVLENKTDKVVLLNNNRINSLSPEYQEKYDTIMKPLYKSYFYNNWFNNHMLNQLTSGFNGEYKDAYDQIKRTSMVNGMGSKGRINNETGTKSTFNLAVAHDLSNSVEDNTPFISNFEALRGANYDYSDAQSFIIPWRADNVKKGFSRYSNNGEILKNLYSGYDSKGDMVGVKTSSRELSDKMVAKDIKRRAIRKWMEFGRMPNSPRVILGREIKNLKQFSSEIFNKIHNSSNASEEDKIMYNELLKFSEDNNYMIHELAFTSAVKMGNPTTAYSFNFNSVIDPQNGERYYELSADKTLVKALRNNPNYSASTEEDPILTLNNDGYRLQLNPRKAEYKNREVQAPSQLIYQLSNNPQNFHYAKEIYNLIGKIHHIGILNTKLQLFDNKDGVKDLKSVKKFLTKTINTLSSVPGQEALASKLQELLNSPVGAINLGFVSNKLAQTLISIYEKNTVRYKAPGGGYVLETSAYMENPPQIVYEIKKNTEEGLKKNGILSSNMTDQEKARYDELIKSGEYKITSYYAEVHVPRSYIDRLDPTIKSLGNDRDILSELQKRGLDKLMGYRIPSTELHSAIPLKIAGFNESGTNDNIITAPAEIVLLHGSDYDVDKLYIMDPFVPSKDIDIPYKAIDGSIRYETLYKGLPIGYEYTTREDERTPVPREVPEGFSSYGEYLINYVYNNTNQLIQDQLNNRYINTVLSKDEISNILNVYQNIAYGIVQENFINTIQDTNNLNNMMKPITLKPINDVTNPDSIFSRLLPLVAKSRGETFVPLDKWKGSRDKWDTMVNKILKPTRELDNAYHQDMMFRDNAIAANLVGIFASGAKGVANLYNAVQDWASGQLSDTTPQFKEDYHFMFNGEKITGFNRKISGYGYTYSEQLDMLINAAIDHVKEQILNILNIGADVAKETIALTAMGRSLFDISTLVNQPIILDYINIKNMPSGLEKVKESYINKILDMDNVSDEERENELNKILEEVKENSSKEDFDPFNMANMAATFMADPSNLTKEQLYSQIYILQGFDKISRIGDDISKAARVSGTSSDIDQNIQSIQEKVNDYNMFTDGKSVFENVDFTKVPHIDSAFKVQNSLLNDASSLFLKNNKVAADFIINTIEPFLKRVGVSVEDEDLEKGEKSTQDSNNVPFSEDTLEDDISTKDAEDIDKELAIQEKRLSGNPFFINEKKLRKSLDSLSIPLKSALGNRNIEAINKMLEKIVDYLLPMGSVSSSFVNMDFNTKTQPSILTVFRKEVKDEDGIKRKVPTIVEINGVNAWVKSFLQHGYNVLIYDNREGSKGKSVQVKVKSLAEVVQKYSRVYKALSKLIPNAPSFTSISFTQGTAMNSIETMEFEEELEELIEVPIYEYNGRDLSSRELAEELNLEEPQFNHLQASLAKYAVLKEGLSFGSQRISKNIPAVMYQSLSKSLSDILNSLYYKGRSTSLDISKASGNMYNFETFAENFLAKFLLTQGKTLGKGLSKAIDKTQDDKIMKGVDIISKTGDRVFYDAKITYSSPKNSKLKYRPFISVRGEIMMAVYPSPGTVATPLVNGEFTVYYQTLGKAQEQYSFYNSIENLSNEYRMQDKLRYNIPSIGVSTISKDGNNNYSALIPLTSLNNYGEDTIKRGDIISLYPKGDSVKESAQQFYVNNITVGDDITIDRQAKRGNKVIKDNLPAAKLTLTRVDPFDVSLERALNISTEEEQKAQYSPVLKTSRETLLDNAVSVDNYISSTERSNITISKKALTYKDISNNPDILYLVPNDVQYFESAEEMNRVLHDASLNNLALLYVKKNNGILFNSREYTEFQEELNNTMKIVKSALSNDQKVSIPSTKLTGEYIGEKNKITLNTKLQIELNNSLKEIGILNNSEVIKSNPFNEDNSINLSNMSDKQRTAILNNTVLYKHLSDPEVSREEKEQLLKCNI